MLTIQKNDIFAAVTEAHLDPAAFKIEEFERTTFFHVLAVPLVFEAMHAASSFTDLTYRYTAFAPGWPYSPVSKPKNYSQLSPSRKQVVDSDLKDGWRPVGNWCSFQDVLRAFTVWLKEHVRPALAEAEATDLWNAASSALPSFEDVPPDQAKSFTAEQRRQLKIALEKFADSITLTFAPDNEQLREIRTRILYLSDALERLNTFDWRALALSTVIGIGTSLSVDTQSGRQLWALFHQAMRTVGHLLGS